MLSRRWVWPALCLVLFLAGCTPTPQIQPAIPTATRRVLPSLATTPTPSSAMQCLVVAVQPTSGPTQPSLFPVPGPHDHASGPVDSSVTFLEYTDFQVPAAAALDAVLNQLLKKYPQAVRRVQRVFPLPSNDKSLLAAVAVEAAARQDHYWQMSAALLSGQDAWVKMDSPGFTAWLSQQASALGMNAAQFDQDLRDPQIKTTVDQAQRFGLETGIPVSPFLLVNGQIYQGPRDARSLENLVNLLRMEKMQFTECPPFIIDPNREYTATLETKLGKITLQLYPKEAPMAVNNFVFLARQGWYDGMIFHRVIENYLAQTGDPSGSGYGSPGYAFPDEISTLRFDRPGVVAMANAGPDSNGSQFFITYRAIPEMNGQHTIFGQVIEGMEVLAKLAQRDPSQTVDLSAGEQITKVTIQEK